MDTPFGDRPLINFKYRLSERLRRVYEHDAVGHLLTMRYFKSIFGSASGSRLRRHSPRDGGPSRQR